MIAATLLALALALACVAAPLPYLGGEAAAQAARQGQGQGQAQGQGQRQGAQQKPAPAPRAEPETIAPLDVPPPYERQLLRLAEILGALAWLTELCGEADGGAWRARMGELLDVEGATDGRRERLAGAFNRGFRGYAAMHRRCTPNGELVIARFLEEGSRIARDVATRYSG